MGGDNRRCAVPPVCSCTRLGLNLLENRNDPRRWACHQSSKCVHDGEPDHNVLIPLKHAREKTLKPLLSGSNPCWCLGKLPDSASATSEEDLRTIASNPGS